MGNLTIFETIREDHDRQRRLLNDLVNTSGDSELRRNIFEKVKTELDHHAIAEERHFYIPLIEKKLTVEKARHGIAEHHEIDELVESLEKTEFDSSAWLVNAKKLQHKVEHHLDEEEQQYFQLAGKVMAEEEKKEFAEGFTSERYKLEKEAK